MISSLVAFLIVWTACTRLHIDASPATLAAALALSLARDTERVTWPRFAYRLIGLPVIALGAGAVGIAFTRIPMLAAVLFTLAISASVYLRRFGTTARVFGRLIALPFIAMLAVPVRVHGSILPVLGAGLVSVLIVTVQHAIVPPAEKPERPQRKRPGIDPSTRMAIQMFVALALAFIAGYAIIPQHWFWVVLTAFIVCSGAIARGDAVYKAVLRVGGALAGTAVAAVVTPILALPPAGRAAAIFAVLFGATALRKRNYAYWAAGMTLVFALLQGDGGTPAPALFAQRVAGIVLGAICAVLSTWFVLPVRTRQLMRLRRGQLFAALKSGNRALVKHRAAELHQTSRPLLIAARAREFLRAGLKRRAPMNRSVRVHISVAMSIDGYIDDRHPQRLMLSNDEDMRRVRDERARYDAVLVGANTVRRDNPSLRGNDAKRAPARITITKSGNLDATARFFDGGARTIVLCDRDATQSLRERLGERAEVFELTDFAPEAILDTLSSAGIRSVFIEGGTQILTAFLGAGAFDRLRLSIAPFFAGEAGGARIVDPATFFDGPEHRLILVRASALGDMAVLEYERQHP